MISQVTKANLQNFLRTNTCRACSQPDPLLSLAASAPELNCLYYNELKHTELSPLSGFLTKKLSTTAVNDIAAA